MRCDQIPAALVSDDPGERRRAERHAAGCTKCAAIVAGHRWLASEVEAWRDATPDPPAELRAKVLASLQEATAGGRGRFEVHDSDEIETHAREGVEIAGRAAKQRGRTVLPFPVVSGRRWAWLAAAATVLLAALVVWGRLSAPRAPERADTLMVTEALEEALAAERAHARAIARLEEAAAPLLTRASDPEVSARYAALLFSYRDRLAHLDQTIAEVQSFLDDNPAHTAGRTMLLAAFAEKTRVLEELIQLQEEIPS